MSIKKKTKGILFHFLEVIPENQANWLYHQIQKFFGNESLESKFNSAWNTFKTYSEITKKNDIKTEGKVIIEIGSGWLPLMPYFFYYLGKASEVRTYDLNRHYQKKNIQKLNALFSERYRVEVREGERSIFLLPESIHYYPDTNIVNERLTDGDLIFSRFVLEHLNSKDIEEIHLKLKKELRPGSHIIHLISPSDHRAYIDNSLSLQDFLKYSEEEWERKQTRFNYHNRLRLPQYLQVFNRLDLEIVHLTYEVPDKKSEVYRKFKNLSLHKDFKNFTDEELTAGSINIILKV